MRIRTGSVTWAGGKTSEIEPDDDACPICNRSHRTGDRNLPARIVVAEDDPAIAQLIAYNLAQDGHLLRRVADGAAVIRAVQELPADLLVLDLLLPLQSGWRVLRELRSRGEARLAALPVLVVSALACQRLQRELERSGAQRVLGKPFSVTDLRETVRDLLDASFTRTQSIGTSHGADVDYEV